MAHHSSPCAAGICWVGRITGAGLASPTVAVDAGGEAAACAAVGAAGLMVAAGAGGVADLVSTAADCCGAGSAGFAATAGLGEGIGTVRLATWGTEAGGRGTPRITVGAGMVASGPWADICSGSKFSL